MEGVERRSKRAREEGPLLFGVQLIKQDGKEDELVEAEAEVEAAPQGAEAIVVSSETPAKPPAAVQVDKGRLYCSLCSSLLKPPIYQTAPPPASSYAHCPGLDHFFADLRVPCRYAEYGCESFVPYFRSDEHRDACGHAPCHCPEPGCYLICSPTALAAHLAGEHSWPVDEIAYGTPRMLAVPVPPPPAPAPAPARHVRLLRGDDASVFAVAAGPLGGGAAVSVVLVRADSPAHPRLACTFCAKPPPESAAAGLEEGSCCFFATMPVRSSALADGDGVALEKELYFAVPGEMLCEGSRELLVSVRIDRSCGPEPASEDYKMVAQN
ncbi:hypothetical protein SETIT_5G084000v2 [Setaria italica]|uniref:SIAH-type domain-containing protein n=2 Tax=Setaria italica TaxID=4555 RepID=A0A368R2L7_SETIT|nr:hypothetical protein SETIT_5G084000v2 [Setaria italica]